MELLFQYVISSLMLAYVQGALLNFVVPAKAPSGAVALDPAPVGISFEFFTFPSYFLNVSATAQCLRNFEDLTGSSPHIRIGGTTQDRARYDAASDAYVSYSVASPNDAPASLTFGPAFMSLAATYNGSVVLGLNRGKNDIRNTIDAAKMATSKMDNLRAIELGNEPEYYVKDGQPIAKGVTWNPAADAKSQNNWDIEVGSALGMKNIIQAGNSNDSPPTWGAAELIATQNATVKSYVHDYAHHNYPGGDITTLMSHSNIVKNLARFPADIAAATGVGKEYVLGETNSVSGGGAKAVSPLYGAALWTMDYVLRASLLGIKRTYFHHGTIGNCYYCFWGRYTTGAPYYGAYTAVAAMAGGAYISALDTGSTGYAAYVIYDSTRQPIRVLLYNSDYYDGSTRSSQTFMLSGLTGSPKTKRLTAPKTTARVEDGQGPTFGGQSFASGSCLKTGAESVETVKTSNGSASFVVGASEALLVYLQ